MPSTGTIKRVEIEGQFDPSNPWIAFNAARTPCRIQREALSNVTNLNNWNAFCDEADQILLQLQNPKRTYFILSGLSLFMFIILVVGNFALRSVFYNDGGDQEGNFILYISVGAALFIFSAIMIMSVCKLQNALIRIFGQIDGLCQRYSIPNVVTYSLRTEWWGGCSKAYSKRRFLNVNVYNGTGNDVEQQHHHHQQQQQVVIAAESIVDNPTTGAMSNGNNNSSSLFNQLASGMN